MSEVLDAVRGLLLQLFRLEHADLDFGIHRVMNLRRQALEDFLDTELLSEVHRDLPTSEAVEQVLSHLLTFFRRYYESGDFVALRRYRPGVYAIPYEGEEVKLHFANAQQYFVKSAEHLKNYAFAIGGRRVEFVVVRASFPRGNDKAVGSELRYSVQESQPVQVEGQTLQVRFVYGPADARQSTLNASAAARIVEFAPEPWRTVFRESVGGAPNPLASHLRRFTTRQTYDYFIHKDLGGFLRRELDFFIKTEIFDLAGLERPGSGEAIVSQLANIRVLRSIAHRVIAFVAQLEDFQKRLWLKQRLVVEAQYCVSIDRVPDALLPEVCGNERQLEAWSDLFGVGLENPSPEDLKQHPGLIVDTALFDASFRETLVESLGEDVSRPTGILMHADAVAGLRHLREGALEFESVYFDPPYNTGNDGFPYKDGYRHSTWLCMMRQVLGAVRRSIRDGTVFISIDDNQIAQLRLLLADVFGVGQEFGPIVVQTNKGGRDYLPIAVTHESILCVFTDGPCVVHELPNPQLRFAYQDPAGGWNKRDLRNRNPRFSRDNRPNLHYPFYVDPNRPDSDGFFPVFVEPRVGTIEIRPINSKGEDSVWRWGLPKSTAALVDGSTAGSQLVAGQTKAGKWNVYEKSRRSLRKAKSIWDDASVRTENGSIVLRSLFGDSPFPHPKSLQLVQNVVNLGTSPHGVVLDCMAGSGTTGHAVLDLNRSGAARRFVLIESGPHFDRVLKPRVLKAAFASRWKDGKPESTDPVSVVVKVIRLESYEDSLENLCFSGGPLDDQQMRSDYVQHHLLDVGTSTSPCFVPAAAFADPFSHRIRRVGAEQPVDVDLVETFGALLGLRVEVDHASQWWTGRFEQTGDGLQLCDAGPAHRGEAERWRFRLVVGRTPRRRRVAVIWRTLSGDPERDNLVLQAFVAARCLPAWTLDTLYVNGDCDLERVRGAHDTWTVELVEDEFRRRLFDQEDD